MFKTWWIISHWMPVNVCVCLSTFTLLFSLTHSPALLLLLHWLYIIDMAITTIFHSVSCDRTKAISLRVCAWYLPVCTFVCTSLQTVCPYVHVYRLVSAFEKALCKQNIKIYLGRSDSPDLVLDFFNAPYSPLCFHAQLHVKNTSA